MTDAAASLAHNLDIALLGQTAAAYLAIYLTMREPEEPATVF
jgi:hypothetical protein